MDSAVTARGGRNPPGSGHHKALLEIRSSRQGRGGGGRQPRNRGYLSVASLQQGFPSLELRGTDGQTQQSDSNTVPRNGAKVAVPML